MFTCCRYSIDGRLPADPSLTRLTKPALGHHPRPPGGFEARDTPGTEVTKAGEKHAQSAISEHPALCNRRRDCRSVPGRDRYGGVYPASPSALRLSRIHRQSWNFFSLRPPASIDMSFASRPTRATGNYR